MTCPEFEHFLYPYLDGEFDDSERAEFEQHLVQCPSCAARTQSERTMQQAIRAKLKGCSASPPAPEALRENLRHQLRREHRQTVAGHWARYAAAAAVVAVAGATGWHYSKPDTRQRFVEDAAARHARRYPLEIQHASPSQVEAWFVGKLDYRVWVPLFPRAQLAGARLANVQNKQAAYIRYDEVTSAGTAPGRMGLLVYEDKAGDADFRPEPELQTSHGYNVASWREGDVVYHLVNDLDEADIRQMLANERHPSGPSLPTKAAMNPLPSIPVQPASFQR
jgi:mycothiol system anti-sigma-R factor